MYEELTSLAASNEAAKALLKLISEDGAGTWPPTVNHHHDSWPTALQPYKEIYHKMAHLLPVSTPYLHDDVNEARIKSFRLQFRRLLEDNVNIYEVENLLKSVEAGSWDQVSRETYNALYSCLSWSRHAYRWGTLPVVKVAQLEELSNLPEQLTLPWQYLQKHFGCTSEAGNITSCMILNFDQHGKYIHIANSGLEKDIVHAEEDFSRIIRDVESLALPIYLDMILSIIAFSKGDMECCAIHLSAIASQLRPTFNVYFGRMHDTNIPFSKWLSHVQGFYAWEAGYMNKESGELVKFDGLSGNQVMLFQALDAFLGLDEYLSPESLERNVPSRQRDFCSILRKNSFRKMSGYDFLDPHIKLDL
ncbi:hypothetical protein NQ176_g4931 [Zarea fungicola]|uniref:Uncharacterized protein n=1 Tax=Zarea fungicola TaxID=93591 RepID=A0ACC1NDI6_9HYPO|nr:hypothetical protein NQ176_g4931 [Lecanicillium fungicola]